MKRKLRTPKTLNKLTGKESTTEYAFSINNWGSATTAYMKSVNKKGDIAIKTTTSMARKLLKKSSGAGLEKYLRLGDASDSEEIDSRAMLW